MSQDIVIMAVTSQTEWSFDIGECLVKDWEGAGLLKPSAIKTPISTIEQRVVLRKLGALSADDPASLNNLLRVPRHPPASKRLPNFPKYSRKG
jgi:mRNA interferase MazF